MIYSHFVFVCLRVITILLVSTLPADKLAGLRSFVYSLDTIFTIIIYFVPKFVALSSPEATQRSSTNHTTTNAMQRVIAKISGGSLHFPSAHSERSESSQDDLEDTNYGSSRIPSLLREHSSLPPVEEGDVSSDTGDNESSGSVDSSNDEGPSTDNNA